MLALVDDDWLRARRALETWLLPANFDERGVQRRAFEEVRRELGQRVR